VAEQDAIFQVVWGTRAWFVAQTVATDIAEAVTPRAGIRYLGIYGTWRGEPVIGGTWRGEPVIGGAWHGEPVIGGHWIAASVESFAEAD
jgi:hypothetical protein